MKNKAFASLEKALDILTIFDINRTSFTAQEISQKLNLPVSTTYKYFDVLRKRGFLNRKDGSKNFRLGFMTLRLGSAFLARFDLIDVAFPHMKSLLEQCGETILLTSIQGWDVICLGRLETQRLVKLSMERGRTLPLHAGDPHGYCWPIRIMNLLMNIFSTMVYIHLPKTQFQIGKN